LELSDPESDFTDRVATFTYTIIIDWVWKIYDKHWKYVWPKLYIPWNSCLWFRKTFSL